MFSQYQWLTNLPSIKTQCSSNPNLRPTFTQLKPNVLPILILCLQADHCMTLSLPPNAICFSEMPLLQSKSLQNVLKIANLYWAGQLKEGKGCRQTLDCYCVSYELLSASIALWFVYMVCLPLIAERNTHEICLTQECLQIVRHLLWKQTTSHSLRNNNPMFDGNLWPNSFDQPSNS